MKQLGVKHSKTQVNQILDLMDCLGASQSDLVRSAMYLGMQQLKELAARDKDSAQELLAITAFKAMQ